MRRCAVFNKKRFLDDVAEVADGDYATAFKMLGFVLYVSESGADGFLSGAMVSPRTYYRWVETIKAAGWASLLSDVRLEQALQEYVGGLNAQPEEIRAAVLQKLDVALSPVPAT
jgi:hypothetical protein